MNTQLRRMLAVAVFAAAVMAGGRLTLADDQPAANNQAAKTDNAAAQQVTYLGVLVEPLHPAFWAHLRDVLEHKQGLLVAQVAKDSPAERAGLEANDILTKFDDQKLFSPEQLLALVQADKAGDQVTLGIARNGKPQEVQVTLGEHAAASADRMSQQMMHMPRWMSRWMPRAGTTPSASSQGESDWTSFDSLSLKSLGNNRFHVEIGYETEHGKIEHRTFEGTREQIHQDVLAQKDLPANERAHLLRALDLPNEEVEFNFPSAYFTPDGRLIWQFSNLNAPF